jgi:selenide, water dikinase
LGPEDLAQVLCHLDNDDKNRDPNLIVGFDKSDDAGVYKISPEIALVQTIDFFTPVVDDPYLFGQIAAANSLSDVYAMGGKPLTVLNVACFSCSLDPAILADILKGGAQKINESGAILVGGHTVTDKEVKYGLSVTGTVDPKKVVTNSGAKPGDVLILTKPIGTGILTTAFKFDAIGEKELREGAIVMSTLNKAASEAMQKIGANACTDITGFGLLGHSYEMANSSGVELKINSSKVPLMEKVIELIEKDFIPGGAYSNMQYFGKWINFDASIAKTNQIALFDPQTSGGLFISVPKEKAVDLLDELHLNSVVWAKIIGEVVEKGTQKNVITVV